MNNFVIASLVLIAAAVVNSYDFEDSFYNEFLSSELEDTKISLDHSRVRRDAEDGEEHRHHHHHHRCPHKWHYQQCCNANYLAVHRHQLEENKKECFLEVYSKNNEIEHHDEPRDPFKCNKVDKHKQEMTCFMECIARKRNLVDEDGNIKEAQFTAWVKDNFNESWIIDNLDDILPKSYAKARSAAKLFIMGKSENTCNPAFLKVLHGLFRQIQMTCPDEEIKDAKTCSKFRERVKMHEMRMTTPQPEND